METIGEIKLHQKLKEGKTMMPAAKNMDIVMGVDIHLVQPPGPSPPLPIPHPFIGMIFDPFDYVPIIGGTVMVNGQPRATAGSGGKNAPPHIPLGGSFIKPIGNEAEVFMGSQTVLADGEPFSYMALPVLSCQCIGMPPPPRQKKGKKIGFFLPTSVVLPIPAGLPVLVGGPPTINMMALAFKAGLSGLKKLRKLQKGSKAMKKVSGAIHKAAKKAMDKMKIPKGLRNAVHKGICTVTGHPVDVATGMVFTEKVDFELPGPIPFTWERTWYSTSDYQGPLGHGWHHPYDLALSIEEDAVAIRMEDGRSVYFSSIEVGETAFDRKEKLTLYREESSYKIRTKDRLFYHFANKPNIEDVFPLVSIEDVNGYKIRLTYGNQGYLSEIIDSSNRKLQFECNQTGKILSIYAPHPTKQGEIFPIVQYKYDENGNLVEVIDALKHSAFFTYDKHLLVREMDRNRFSFYFEYQGEGIEAKCINTWGDGGVYNHKLTFLEGQTIVENSLGFKTEHFHKGGLVYKTIDPKKNASTKRYNEFNELMAETNELGYTTTYQYDDRGNQVRKMEPDGAMIQIEYFGDLPIAAIDAVKGQWKWKYDEKGNLLKRIDSLNQETAYDYHKGLLSRIIDPAGGIALLQYDSQYNLTILTTPDGHSSKWEYDILGNCIHSIDPKKNVQKRHFNLLRQVIKVEEPDGNIRTLRYGLEGNIIRTKDKQYDVRFEYKGYNKLIARIESGTRVDFFYDTEEQLISIRNEKGYKYRFELNENGEVIVEKGFDDITRKYIRNPTGLVEKVLRPNDMVKHYNYDLNGRVIGVKYFANQKAKEPFAVEKYAYRADGELIEATNDDISVKFERDLLGRVIKEDQGGYSVESFYDALGMRKEMKSSLGTHLLIERNIMGDVKRMEAKRDEKSWDVSFKRDKFGLEMERTLPGNVSSTWLRDSIGRPVKQETTVAGVPVRTRTYTWSFNDRLKELTDPIRGTIVFKHDGIGNLAEAHYPDNKVEYRNPDEVGNLYSTTNRKDRDYGRAGQLLKANGTRYKYDREGNLIEKRGEEERDWMYEWNASGMLAKVIRPDEKSVIFHYDALGRRIAKTFSGKTTRWIWDGNTPLHEWVEAAEDFTIPINASLPRSFPKGLEQNSHWGINKDLITWVFEPETFAPLAKVCGEEQYNIITDHLGSPTTITDKTGITVWSAVVSAFGEMKDVEGDADICPFRWPGQYEDIETSLFYNRFRYYSPSIGQYISQDPIRLLGGLNFFAYTHDPLVWIDIMGLVSGVYHIVYQGEQYVGSSVDIDARLANKNHPASDLLVEKDVKVTITEVDVSHLQSTKDKGRALKVVEQDTMVANTVIPKENSRNRIKALRDKKLKKYRIKYKAKKVKTYCK